MNLGDHPVLLYDGNCALCSWSVRVIAKKDKRKRVHFIAQKSEKGVILLSQYFKNEQQSDSVLLLYKNKIYQKSDAVIKIGMIIGGWYQILSFGYLIPKNWRNAIYDITARNRYQWFGKAKVCEQIDFIYYLFFICILS